MFRLMVFRAGTWTKVGNFESDSIGLEILRPALWAQVNHSVLSELTSCFHLFWKYKMMVKIRDSGVTEIWEQVPASYCIDRYGKVQRG